MGLFRTDMLAMNLLTSLSGFQRAPQRLMMKALLSIALYTVPGLLLCLDGCGRAVPNDKVTASSEQNTSVAPAPVETSANTRTQVEMVNVNIHLDSALVLHVHYLSGQFVPTRKGQPPAFDDKRSYLVAIDSAEVGVTAASMTHALNTYVFNAPDSPLKNVTLTIDGNQIRQTGTLNKGPGIPFEMVGAISATADGRLRIQPTQVKAAHVPVQGLMKLLGLDMAKVMNTRKTRGVSVEGNDIILDATQMMPPPLMRGRITGVSIQGDQIIQTFGTARIPQARTLQGGNYMQYRGGVLRFGKLTMNDTDMKLIDADPTDPFDFFPDHYQEQLVAGYSKNTNTGGLLVYMPDYDKISKPLPPPLIKLTDSHRGAVVR